MTSVRRTYLDYNATAPIRDSVISEMADVWRSGPVNPASIHSFGRAARHLVEMARTQIAEIVGVHAKQIIFNSGATEGNNTVLRAYTGGRILMSAGEHASIRETGALLGATKIPLGPDGRVDLEGLQALCRETPAPALISVMLVNNETGIVQPVADAARIAHAVGAVVHCDAVQALGKIPVDMRALGVDFLTLSAHKIGGSVGVGALIVADGTRVCLPTPVLMTGGGQERGLRAGTENTAGVCGFARAAVEASRDMETLIPRLRTWRQQLVAVLRGSHPGVEIHGANEVCVANTICFSVRGVEAQTMLMNLDLAGIALSSGSACSSGVVKASPVLSAMGVPDDQARGALRLSMGYGTTQEDIDYMTEIWHKIAQKF